MDLQEKKSAEFNEIVSFQPSRDDEANSHLKDGKASDVYGRKDTSKYEKLKAFIAAVTTLLLAGAFIPALSAAVYYPEVIITLSEFIIDNTFISYEINCTEFEDYDLILFVKNNGETVFSCEILPGSNSGTAENLTPYTEYHMEIRWDKEDGKLCFDKIFFTTYGPDMNTDVTIIPVYDKIYVSVGCPYFENGKLCLYLYKGTEFVYLIELYSDFPEEQMNWHTSFDNLENGAAYTLELRWDGLEGRRYYSESFVL